MRKKSAENPSIDAKKARPSGASNAPDLSISTTGSSA